MWGNYRRDCAELLLERTDEYMNLIAATFAQLREAFLKCRGPLGNKNNEPRSHMRCRQSLAHDRAPDAESAPRLTVPHFEARCMGNPSRRMLELSFATSPLRISCGVTSGWL
jgi:hypothetical protein